MHKAHTPAPGPRLHQAQCTQAHSALGPAREFSLRVDYVLIQQQINDSTRKTGKQESRRITGRAPFSGFCPPGTSARQRLDLPSAAINVRDHLGEKRGARDRVAQPMELVSCKILHILPVYMFFICIFLEHTMCGNSGTALEAGIFDGEIWGGVFAHFNSGPMVVGIDYPCPESPIPPTPYSRCKLP